VNKLISNLF